MNIPYLNSDQLVSYKCRTENTPYRNPERPVIMVIVSAELSMYPILTQKYYCLLSDLSQESTCFQTERSWVLILARYSVWPGYYNKVGFSARLKTRFELTPVTEGKQGTFPFFTLNPECACHILIYFTKFYCWSMHVSTKC